MQFNVNDYVRVRLNDHGRAIVREKHDELAAFIKGRGGAFHEFRPTVEDADGWSRWQLWDLMHTFGPHIHLGARVPFETTIELASVDAGRATPPGDKQ